jgi:2-oxo-hept-3-ene-1,7-dioate hydratase
MTTCDDILWQIHNNPAGGYEKALQNPNQVEAYPDSLAAGQLVQLQLLQRWLAEGETLGGWKIGMTSGASRNAMGDGIRPFGFILHSRIKTAADTISVQALHRGQIENELCFRMAQPLGAGATAEQAKAAVAEVIPAFEINQKRLAADAPAPLRVADNLSNWGIVIGDGVSTQTDISNLTVTLREGERVIEQVVSKNHIDNHYESLATLANHLAQYDRQLLPGQYVITGAYGKTPFAQGVYQGDFDNGVGTVTAHLQ